MVLYFYVFKLSQVAELYFLKLKLDWSFNNTVVLHSTTYIIHYLLFKVHTYITKRILKKQAMLLSELKIC